MTHYQRLATLIFRIVGVIVIIGSLISWIPSLFISFIPEFRFLASAISPLFTLFTVLPYLLIGIILFVSSKFLAKWICFDLDN